MRKPFIAIVLAALVSGCAFADIERDGLEAVGTAKQAVGTALGSATVYPIKRKNDIKNGHPIVLDKLTKLPVPAWDQTEVEMLVADEYAKCLAEVAGLNIPFADLPDVYPSFSDSGPGLKRIEAAVQKNECPASNPERDYPFRVDENTVVLPSAPIEWALRRSNPACNYDPGSGEYRQAIELPETDPQSLVSSLVEWHKASHRGFKLNGDPLPTGRNAYLLVYRGEIGLCFAERINGLLESSQAFAASTEEHMLLLGLAHERSQDAMLKLGTLLKLAQSPVPMAKDNYGGAASGGYLRAWIDNAIDDPLNRIRSQFLKSLTLTASSATTLATFLQRQAGARWTSTGSASAFERDWGPGSARSRLMNLVFGGGVLNDIWGESSFVDQLWFPEVVSHTTDPQVAVLFSLAREADALYLRSTNGHLHDNSWEAMYQEIEFYLRTRECFDADPAKCAADVIRASLPPLSAESSYLLVTRYGITQSHAKTFVAALHEAGVKADMVTHYLQPQPDFSAFRLVGEHTNTQPPGHLGETGWIKLDPRTVLIPPSYDDRAYRGLSTCSSRWPDENYPGTCLQLGPKPGDYVSVPEEHGQLGVVSALSVAREVLFHDASMPISDGRTVQAVANGLRELERLLGTTTAIRRDTSVDVIAKSNLGVRAQLVKTIPTEYEPGLLPAAKVGPYMGPNGIGRNTLDAIDATGGYADEVQSGSGPAAGLELDSFQAPPPGTGQEFGWAPGTTLLLRMNDSGNSDYLYLSDNSYVPGVQHCSTVVEGGMFAELATKVGQVQDVDWSRARYDGFGLPVNWVPPADASLMGGSAGEESYQYLLRNARTAAEEATAAVKSAIDRLSEETISETARTAAKARAESIGAMEAAALCGKTDACQLETTSVNFRISDQSIFDTCHSIETGGGGENTCRLAITLANRKLSGTYLPKVVAERLDQGTIFSDKEFEGSELQKSLVRMWNAARLLKQAGEQATKAAVAVAKEDVAASEAVVAAVAAHTAAQDQIEQLKAAFGAANQEKIAQIEKETADAQIAFSDAKARIVDMCGFESKNPSDEEAIDWATRKVWFLPYPKFGAGDTQAASSMRCYEAVLAVRRTSETLKNTAEKNALILVNLTPQPSEGTPDTSEEIYDTVGTFAKSVASQLVAATEQANAAVSQNAARKAEAWNQINTHLSTIVQLHSELASARAELEQLQLRAGQSNARAALEVKLADEAADVTQTFRSKYRAYDVWRARALLESARRLAAAARRCIESRFVVDLSVLDAEQAFVASPSTWADEIYESDLNAPEVVGLSQAPSINGAIYPNKLIDYVGNLERFVQGYTITNPMSVSLPDTEVVTLGAPDQVRTSATGARSLSEDTAGWRFYCAESKSWIAHPGVKEYPVVSRLDTACNGNPPALAKFGFRLDSWGVLNGVWSRPQYTDRHNVRWRRLAVNLVGTGIRDCSRSIDSMSCYTNPYVRFNLLHAGPSWQTNHSGEWRALDISTASIEGGKALAAEEWLESVSNSWNMPYVSNVARGELFGRPAAGNYELVLEITPDVRLDRIERIQLLVEQDYWVKQNGGRGVYETTQAPSTGSGGTAGTGISTSTPSSGGTTGSGGSSGIGGTSGSSSGVLNGACTPTVPSELLLDNFEDGNKLISGNAQRLGLWYGFHAGTCAAVPPSADSFVPTTPAGNGSIFCGHAQGTGCAQSDWSGGGIGFTFLSSFQNGIETVCANYDASAYTGIGFDAKGNGEIRVEICTSDVTNNDCHGAYFGLSGTTWTRYDLRWPMLSQMGWNGFVPFNRAHLRKIQFLSKTKDYSFDVDNVSFLNN